MDNVTLHAFTRLSSHCVRDGHVSSLANVVNHWVSIYFNLDLLSGVAIGLLCLVIRKSLTMHPLPTIFKVDLPRLRRFVRLKQSMIISTAGQSTIFQPEGSLIRI
jgi:hypothetical protein